MPPKPSSDGKILIVTKEVPIRSNSGRVIGIPSALCNETVTAFFILRGAGTAWMPGYPVPLCLLAPSVSWAAQ